MLAERFSSLLIEPGPHDTYADVETSSDAYARRFAGAVGSWFLEVQARATLELLAMLPGRMRILDVGGGHAQLAPALIEAGHEVTVLGSAPSCGARLAPWIPSGRCSFEVGDLLKMPYPDRSFDIALCFRLLPHISTWTPLIAELCRVSARAVIVDYPSTRSVNVVSSRFFGWKQRIEGNTRPFLLFRPGELGAIFKGCGFRFGAARPQFLLPMVLHRKMNSAGISQALELSARTLGLTRLWGSPIIVRADREQE